MFDCGVIQDLLFMARRFERVNPMEPGMASKHFVKVIKAVFKVCLFGDCLIRYGAKFF